MKTDKTLFTPGPLTTSLSVKQAMLRDLGSRDIEFMSAVREIRAELLSLAGASEKTHSAIIMQGSGTFSLEAVVSSVVPPGKAILIAINGAYGRRMARIAEIHGARAVAIEFPESSPVDPEKVFDALQADADIAIATCCHCETTSGIINPVREIGHAVSASNREFCVDAMSSFGAVPLSVVDCGVDYLVSSSNKCIEGVPGFGFVIANLEALRKKASMARTLCLDLLDQHEALERTGQFRFTPPTHALLAFRQALIELKAEGGVEGRAARYKNNYETLVEGMWELGFTEFLKPDDQGYIITSFYCPKDPRFSFDAFYLYLSERGFVIYPGKVGTADCFRIGSIGRIDKSDVKALLATIADYIQKTGIEMNGETDARREA